MDVYQSEFSHDDEEVKGSTHELTLGPEVEQGGFATAPARHRMLGAVPVTRFAPDAAHKARGVRHTLDTFESGRLPTPGLPRSARRARGGSIS